MQFSNAEEPTSVIVFGSVIPVIFALFLNALYLIFVTVCPSIASGIVTFPPLPLYEVICASFPESWYVKSPLVISEVALVKAVL